MIYDIWYMIYDIWYTWLYLYIYISNICRSTWLARRYRPPTFRRPIPCYNAAAAAPVLCWGISWCCWGATMVARREDHGPRMTQGPCGKNMVKLCEGSRSWTERPKLWAISWFFSNLTCVSSWRECKKKSWFYDWVYQIAKQAQVLISDCTWS